MDFFVSRFIVVRKDGEDLLAIKTRRRRRRRRLNNLSYSFRIKTVQYY